MFTGACGCIVWPQPSFKVAHKGPGDGRRQSRLFAQMAATYDTKEKPKKMKTWRGLQTAINTASLGRLHLDEGGGGAARHDSRSKGKMSAGAAHSLATASRCTAAPAAQL